MHEQFAFTDVDTATLAQALYVRAVERAGSRDEALLAALEEHALKSAFRFAHGYNEDLADREPLAVKNVTDLLRKLFDQQDKLEEEAARRLVGLLEEARGRVRDTLAALPADSRSGGVLREIVASVGGALDRVRGQLVLALRESNGHAADLGVRVAEASLPAESGVRFGLNDTLLRTVADYHAGLVTDVTDQVRAAVTREVQLAQLAGTDGADVVKNIVGAGVEPTGPFLTAEQRADAIARTEINRVGNMASYARYEDAAQRLPRLMKTWVTAGDARVRDTHRALNGKTIPMEATFNVGGVQAPYPMYPGLPARETVHCRCRLITKQLPEEEAPPEPTLSQKALLAKQTSRRVAADVQRYSEEHCEAKLAAGLQEQGVTVKSLRDNEPADVVRQKGDRIEDGIELKTMTENRNNKLTMKADAMAKKRAWQEEHKANFHTVVFDDQAVFNAKGEGLHGPDSDRVIYYRRGFGSFRVGTMHKVADMDELRALIAMAGDDLPAAAQPPKGYLGYK